MNSNVAYSPRYTAQLNKIKKLSTAWARGPQLKFTLKSKLIFFTSRPFFSLIYFFYFFFLCFFFFTFFALFTLFSYFPSFIVTFSHFFLFSHFFIFTSPTGKPLAADDRH
jgi:hypothetical protein